MSDGWVEYTLNGKTYLVRRCICGSVHLVFDAGMLGGVVRCAECGARIIHNTIQEAICEWNQSATGDWGRR